MRGKEDILQRFKFYASIYLDSETLKNISIEAVEDFDTEGMIIKFFNRPLGEIISEIKYPQNWKEAVKEAIYNRLKFGVLKKKFPVKYTVYNVVAFYPNISLPEEKCTLTFMQNKQEVSYAKEYP